MSNLKCCATLTCRKRWAFRLHKGWSFATNVKPLQTTELVILHHFWEWMRICLLQLMSWHIRVGGIEWWQLHVPVTRRTWLRWKWKEVCSCKLHLMHSQIKRFRGAHYLTSCNLKSLNLLLQSFIESYIRSMTIYSIVSEPYFKIIIRNVSFIFLLSGDNDYHLEVVPVVPWLADEA